MKYFHFRDISKNREGMKCFSYHDTTKSQTETMIRHCLTLAFRRNFYFICNHKKKSRNVTRIKTMTISIRNKNIPSKENGKFLFLLFI